MFQYFFLELISRAYYICLCIIQGTANNENKRFVFHAWCSNLLFFKDPYTFFYRWSWFVFSIYREQKYQASSKPECDWPAFSSLGSRWSNLALAVDLKNRCDEHKTFSLYTFSENTNLAVTSTDFTKKVGKLGSFLHSSLTVFYSLSILSFF